MNVLILGGTQFIGRHIVETLLASGHRVSILTQGRTLDVRDLARFARTVIESDLGGAFNLAGPRLMWAEFMKILGAESIAWVPAKIIQVAGVTEFELILQLKARAQHLPRYGTCYSNL